MTNVTASIPPRSIELRRNFGLLGYPNQTVDLLVSREVIEADPPGNYYVHIEASMRFSLGVQGAGIDRFVAYASNESGIFAEVDVTSFDNGPSTFEINFSPKMSTAITMGLFHRSNGLFRQYEWIGSFPICLASLMVDIPTYHVPEINRSAYSFVSMRIVAANLDQNSLNLGLFILDFPGFDTENGRGSFAVFVPDRGGSEIKPWELSSKPLKIDLKELSYFGNGDWPLFLAFENAVTHRIGYKRLGTLSLSDDGNVLCLNEEVASDSLRRISFTKIYN